MSDSPGAFDDPAAGAFAGPPDGHDVRCYILDMVAQLAQLAAVHGQHDLATFLAAAPQRSDAAPPGAVIN
jgi:hypothetical protein